MNQPQYAGEPGQDYYSFTNARDVQWSSTGSGTADRIGDIRADIDGAGRISLWDELLEQRNRESWWQAGAATITPVIDPVLDDAALRAQAGGLILNEYGRFDGRGELSVVLPHVQNASGEPMTQGTAAWRAHRAKYEVMLDNRIGYAGYIWDPWLKVYHVRHRVYMPGTQDGRDVGPSWLQPDPIGIAGGLNLFEYCNGDPMSFVDQMGLDALGIFEFIGVALGLGNQGDAAAVWGGAVQGAADGQTIVADTTAQFITLGGAIPWLEGAQELNKQATQLVDDNGPEYAIARGAGYVANAATAAAAALILFEAAGGATMQVTVSTIPGQTVPHLTYGLGEGAMVHGVGQVGQLLRVEAVGNARYLLTERLTLGGVLVLFPQAVVATGGTAVNCATAAFRGFVRGWRP